MRQINKSLLTLLFFSFFSSTVVALDFQVIQIIPSVLTNVQLAHYNFEGSGTGPTLFTLIVDNRGDTNRYENIEIFYNVRITSAGTNHLAYRGKTVPFTIEPNSYTEVLSNDFLMEDNPRTPIHQQHTIEKIENSALETEIINDGTLPTGHLTIILEMTGGMTITASSIEVDVLNPNQLDLISPGVESSGDFTDMIPAYSDPQLLFNWSSDLTPHLYDNCTQCDSKDVFEFQLFKRRTGQTESEALAMQPIYSESLKDPFLSLSSSGLLERGSVYYWRVYGLLQGVIEGRLESTVFVFRYSDIPNPNLEEIKRLLRSILSLSGNEQYLSIVDDYDKNINLSEDGTPFQIDQLQQLEQDLLAGKKEIITVTVE